jgi:hypothetical protein
MEPFSLSRRGRSKRSRQVSWLGLFPTRRAFPSLDLLGTVALTCGFRRPYSGGTAPDSHRTSLEPKARREIYRALKVVKTDYARPKNHKTKGTLKRQSTVEKKMIDAASSGSRPYFSVSMKLITAEGSEP